MWQQVLDETVIRDIAMYSYVQGYEQLQKQFVTFSHEIFYVTIVLFKYSMTESRDRSYAASVY